MSNLNYQTINADIQLKSMDAKGCFYGYASVFNIVDQQNDMIKEGAFSRSVADPRGVKLLWQHMNEEPIGVIEELKEGPYGLYIKARLLLDIPKGREVYSLISNGAINGLSIGYMIEDYDYNQDGVRYINDLTLMEVSVVTFPANVSANITQVKGGEPSILAFGKVLDAAINKLKEFLQYGCL